jgi:2,5-diamino-6-(ribosylamino)-4(3H)-pyrimidinone 5'-phosphate reductase
MDPTLVLHNSISLDGSLTGFKVDMELHYQIAGKYQPQIHLVGSNTAKTGMAMYGDLPDEEEEDMARPVGRDDVPLWVIPDTEGNLMGMLHVCRRFEGCRDVVVMVSERTPREYIEYLEQRDYNYHRSGEDHPDLEDSLDRISRKHNCRTILADTGRILGNLLLEKGLVSEISLLIHPVVVGRESYGMFGGLESRVELELLGMEEFENGCIWTKYRVLG